MLRHLELTETQPQEGENDHQLVSGHMHKARKEITAILPKVDFLIELVDARIPYSSGNPLIAELRDQKPLLKLLNKSDLADPVVTQTWIEYFEAENGVKAIPFDARNAQHARQLLHRGAKLVGREPNPLKPITTMVVGIPNVGKSTLINGMVGRAVAQTGNVPAVTKRQQRIAVDQNYILLDTPGFSGPNCGPQPVVTVWPSPVLSRTPSSTTPISPGSLRIS